MKILIIGLGLFLSGCNDMMAGTYIDPAFRPFVQEFERQYHLTVQTNMVFNSLSGINQDLVAECIYNSPRTINVDPVYWENMEYYGREQVIFHELGHCELNIFQHDWRLGTVGDYQQVPLSIMYPYIFGDMSYYQDNRQYYFNEL